MFFSVLIGKKLYLPEGVTPKTYSKKFINTLRVILKVQSANQKFKFSSTRSTSRSPNKISFS